MENFRYNQTQNTKTGKRIGKDDLLKYIEMNKDAQKNLNIVDLNENVDQIKPTSIEKAKFQGVEEIKYLPENLAKIFKIDKTKYLHTGCLKTINFKQTKLKSQAINLEISLLSSIITCFHIDFPLMPVNNQAIFINKLFERLKNDSMSKFTEFKYSKKYKWAKSDIENSMMKSNYDGKVMKYLSDYFHINIFILDVERDQLYYPGDEYIPYKNTIFVLKFSDNTFQPIFTQNVKVFTPVNQIIIDIRSNLDYVSVINLGETMSMGLEEVEEDLEIYLPNQNNKLKEKRETQSQMAERLEKELRNNTEIFDESMNAFSEGNETNDYESDSKSDNESDNEIKKNDKKNKPKNKLDEEPSVSQETIETTELKEQKTIKKNKENKEEVATKSSKLKKSDKSDNKIKYVLSDIKSSLKVDELKIIAQNIGIQSNGKTKSVLIEEIKKQLTK